MEKSFKKWKKMEKNEKKVFIFEYLTMANLSLEIIASATSWCPRIVARSRAVKFSLLVSSSAPRRSSANAQCSALLFAAT